jgi:hypothetical protein
MLSQSSGKCYWTARRPIPEACASRRMVLAQGSMCAKRHGGLGRNITGNVH